MIQSSFRLIPIRLHATYTSDSALPTSQFRLVGLRMINNQYPNKSQRNFYVVAFDIIQLKLDHFINTAVFKSNARVSVVAPVNLCRNQYRLIQSKLNQTR